MPNGGEHMLNTLGACPHCDSPRIRIRRRVHPYRPWRCRNCDRVFGAPKIRRLLARTQGHILPADIPRLERPSRRLRRRLRIQRLKKILVIAVVLGVLVAVVIAVQQGMIKLPSAQVQLEDSGDEVAVVMPTATPVATTTRLPDTVVAQVPIPLATATFTARPSHTPLANVSVAVMADTPTPTASPAEISTATVLPTPTPISTTTPVPTNTPTATPVPANLLVLDADATVEGYWSDGTANIDLKLSLRNEGSLALEGSHPISISCTLDDSAVDGCSANAQISLPDGFGPVVTDLTLRAPMGTVNLDIDYGGNARQIVQVNVPERILGVDRGIWACYSDREVSSNEEGFGGCYGWYRTTVEKWRSDSTVRVWATGNENYIQAFREMLDEQLASVLYLNFEWVDNEPEADFVAILGVSKSDAQPDRWPTCLHAWGCGGVVDVRKGDLIVHHLDSHDRFLNDYPNLKRVLNGVFIHEALHGLGPTGHAERSAVVLSVMRSSNYLTYIDKAILSLNSHPLVEPGMTMSEVEPLIAFKDELLDALREEPTSFDLLERTLAALQKVDTVRMKIKGGWTGGRCDSRFGAREWATLEIGGFDYPDNPRLAYLQDGDDSLFIFYSDEAAAVHGDGWQHWQRNRSSWNLISRDELWDSTAWWVRNSKLHHTIAELLWYYDANDVEIVNRSNGKITLSAEYNPTETSPLELKDEQLTFNMVIDEDSYEVMSFEWIYHHRDRDYCHTYREEGKDIEYGAEIDIPDAIVERSEYALPQIWNQGN